MTSISALGLDVGDRRIGIAGCDGTGLLATGLDTLWRRSRTADFAALQDWAQRRRAHYLVVGLPLNMDGSVGFQAKKVKRFAQALGQHLELPVEFVDERLTSVQAEANLRALRRPTRGRDRGAIDREAAAIILQQWLDRRRHERMQPAAAPETELHDSRQKENHQTIN
ncbi:MAG: Holliday junction resolvase RuvX [Cyanobacteria bacterium J06648_11]